MSVRGVPVQDLPENQDPSVQFTVEELTGQIIPWGKGHSEGGGVTKRRGRPPKAPEVLMPLPEEVDGAAAEGEGK